MMRVVGAFALLLGAFIPETWAARLVDLATVAAAAPFQSAPTGGTFAAAANDINDTGSMFAGSSPPTHPSRFQLWANTTSVPYTVNFWDGSGWVRTGSVDPTTHLYTIQSSGAAHAGLSSTNRFWAGQGGILNRLNDRLFVGGNTNVNDGNDDAHNLSKDWLEQIVRYSTSNAQIAALSQIGGIGSLGAARMSDGVPSSFGLGVAGFCVNDQTAAPTTSLTTCAAGYFEARRSAGAYSSNIISGIEIDAIELNDVSNPVRPYGGVGVPGMSNALWLASGGSVEGAHPASLALGIVPNSQPFLSGIMFHKAALSGDDGTTGTAEAIAFAKGHQIDWYEPTTGTVAATIRSDAANARGPVSIVFGANLMTLNGIVAALTAQTTPEAPGPGTFYLYMDKADNKLKAKGPSGTVTVLADP
jgi:hypothetical protein